MGGERFSQATALCKNLDTEIKELESTIQKDEKSLKEMDTNLDAMKLEADRLQRKLAEEEKLVNAMSPGEGLGMAIKQFDNEMDRVKGEYKHLRGRHADAIQ